MVTVVALLAVLGIVSIVAVPRMFGWSTLVVLSGSMTPAMPVGGLAFVAPVQPQDVKAGDVVTYYRPDKPGTLVSHRVVVVSDQLGEPTVWTKGDANEAPDHWAVPASAVVGEVRFTVPYLGRLSRHMQTREGFLTVLAVPAALLIISESFNIVQNLWRLWRLRRERRSAAL
jgi:signal peptidase